VKFADSSIAMIVSLSCLVGCKSDRPISPDDDDEPTPALNVPAPGTSFNPLPERQQVKTSEGLGVLVVAEARTQFEGQVEWLSPFWSTVRAVPYEASDGAEVYLGIRNANPRSDVLVRGGQMHFNVVEALQNAPTEHPGGCGAAANGAILISAPTAHGASNWAWHVERSGAITEFSLPDSTPPRADCAAWLDSTGDFTIGIAGLVRGRLDSLEHIDDDRRWSAGRAILGRAGREPYCFAHCNASERAGENQELAEQLVSALGGCFAQYAAHGDWIAGRCDEEPVVARIEADGQIEQIALPYEQSVGARIALLEDGTVVMTSDVRRRHYLIWPADSDALVEREVEPTEYLAMSAPPVLLRGLPPHPGSSTVAAIPVGEPSAYSSTNTIGYDPMPIDAQTRAREADRAAEFLASTELVFVHRVAVDLACGGTAELPIDEVQAMPREGCIGLQSVAAIPARPNILLGLGRQNDLMLLRIGGEDPWLELGTADAIDGIPGRAPATPARHSLSHGWASGGAAIVGIGPSEILVTPQGASTLPPGTVPMSVALDDSSSYGAVGQQLVVCRDGCFVVSPGVESEILGVVALSAETVLLIYDDERIGYYAVPTSGESVTQHLTAAALARELGRR
jgi:hypothetical protein